MLAAAVFTVVSSAVQPGLAHKAITSPYTFTEDVAPILREHCAACHADGTPAPMSLRTHVETVPWAASMLVELVAGHMPPWSVEGDASRFRNVKQLAARDLDVLLTWAAGGTPAGPAAAAPAPVPAPPAWPLGKPDLELSARLFTMRADVREDVQEFRIATGTREDRWLRAVDLLPGDTTIVRSATVTVAPAGDAAGASVRSTAGRTERLLALWLPGDRPMPAEGAGFLLPAGSQLVLRVHYRKTWLRERDVVRDRSTVGLYFAPAPTEPIRAVTLEPTPPSTLSADAPVTFSRTLDAGVKVLAIYPAPGLHDATLTVRATRPDGTGETLIAFRPQADWARRYWFSEPVALPAGTRLDVRASTDAAAALPPPGALPRAPSDARDVRVTLNVIPAG
jgi:hypothetical protein